MAVSLKIGSRGSQLALWQARWVQARLAELGVETVIEIIRTTGDKITDVPLAKVGGKGLFTKEIEEALLDGRVDLAVHSLKDLPTELGPGLAVAAIPERETPFDALVGSTLAGLKQGAKVGTSSLRRSAQLKRARPDLAIENLRGNLDTRLRKLDEGQYDAIVLAGAGLRRLGWGERIAELLPPEVMCPAVGQGALAIETRGSGEALEICRRLDHAETRAAVEAERTVLAGLGGGCQVPIGAHAVLEGGRLRLLSVVLDPETAEMVRDERAGSPEEAAELGAAAARRLLESGARAILERVYQAGLPLAGKRIVVTRAEQQAAGLAGMLRSLGAAVEELPAIATVAEPFEAPDLAGFDWLVFSSANGVAHFCDRVACDPRPRVCAVGPATAEALESRGWRVDLVPARHIAEGVAEALAEAGVAGRRVLWARAAQARDIIPLQLEELGARVAQVAVYRTVAPDGLGESAARVFSSPADWVVFSSGSTVRNLVAAAGVKTIEGARIASIGPVTSAAARELGLEVACEASPSTAEGLVAAILAAGRRP